MGLDYTIGSVNFRDVGEFINLIAKKPLLQEKRLFRGGKTDYCKSAAEIGNPGTIINLRQGKDKKGFEANNLHFPIGNNHEKYNTSEPEVHSWLNSILKEFENSELAHPVFIHCLSGKDRTGIVIGVILQLLEIPREIIVEEYLLSDGEVREELFVGALDGVLDQEVYFKRINLPKVKENLSSWYR